MNPIKAVKGTRDILPPSSAVWNHVEAVAREVFRTYNYLEIRTPIFEETALFARGVGDEYSKRVSLQFKIVQVEDALRKASKESGHAMLQNPSTGAKQGCPRHKLFSERNQVVLIPAGSVQKQQRYFWAGLRCRNEAVNEAGFSRDHRVAAWL